MMYGGSALYLDGKVVVPGLGAIPAATPRNAPAGRSRVQGWLTVSLLQSAGLLCLAARVMQDMAGAVALVDEYAIRSVDNQP